MKIVGRKTKSTSASARVTNSKPPADVIHRFTHIFDMMAELSAFHLDTWTPDAKTIDYLPIVAAGWRVFGSNLRELRLNVPSRALAQILSPSLRFNRLEILDINFPRANDDQEPEIASIMTGVLDTFLNNHQPTLESIKISKTCYDQPKADISTVLLALGHFPRLTAINLDAALAPSGFGHLLELHAQSLLDLVVMHHHTGSYNSVKLPHLKSLQMGLNSESLDISTTVNYLRQFVNSLTSLKLSYYECHYTDVQNIVEVFAGENRLRALSVRLDFLSPQLLDFMAKNIPGLDQLDLTIRGFQDHDTEDNSVGSQEEGVCSF
jgi:hypothetical protein